MKLGGLWYCYSAKVPGSSAEPLHVFRERNRVLLADEAFSKFNCTKVNQS